jgi:hypothetical protein
MLKLFMVFMAMAVGAHFANAQERREPSTAAERQRFLAIVPKIAAHPLDESLYADRNWAVHWLEQVPDITVSICTAGLGDFYAEKHSWAPLMTIQLTLSEGAFAVKHRGKQADLTDEVLAGVAGMLDAWRALRDTAPESPALDALLEKQAHGELAAFVRKAVDQDCKKKANGQGSGSSAS